MKKKGDIRTRRSTASAMHRHVLGLARQAFPGMKVKEEQTLDVEVDGRSQKLFVDIVVWDLNVCIECHGRQHYEFVPHFHSTRERFKEQQQRDAQKAEAIDLAGMTLVVVRHDEYEKMTVMDLIRRITQALKNEGN